MTSEDLKAAVEATMRTATGSGGLGEPAETGAGSNWWALSGDRTETGKPLFANDPHLATRVPTLWYEVHLEEVDGDVIQELCRPGAEVPKQDRVKPKKKGGEKKKGEKEEDEFYFSVSASLFAVALLLPDSRFIATRLLVSLLQAFRALSLATTCGLVGA